jgi:hypothetical protein
VIAPRWCLLVLLPSLLLAGCGSDGGRPAPQAVADPSASAESPCLQGAAYHASGEVPVEPLGPGDARRVTGLRWQAHPGCERFVIDLGGTGDGAAEAPGAVRVEVLRDLGVVRVFLPGVERAEPEATEFTDGGELAGATYAVLAEDRSLHVDLLLASAAEVNVSLLRDPARVVIDLRPGGAAVPPLPARGERVVVLAPRAGEAGYPLTVSGYARTFEANVVARLERGGAQVAETFTTATGWLEGWGWFSLTLDEGPAGPVQLHVGEHSARDGTWEGIAVELRMR